jgi:hypothetical protein
MRAEQELLESPAPTLGAAEAILEDAQPHDTHVFLYLPDLSSPTRWAAHRVPERVERPETRRPVGFTRRRER